MSGVVILEGPIPAAGVAPLLQAVGIGRQTSAVRLFDGANLLGQLWLRSGKVLAAEYGESEGAAALSRIVAQRDGSFAVSTEALAELPEPLGDLRTMLADAHERYRSVHEGAVATYIPVLAAADPTWFGACVTGVAGDRFEVGDAAVDFSIQSISKVFVFALVCDAIGVETARQHLGVNNSGLAFDSVIAIEQHPDRLTNPMANPGAIATTSYLPAANAEQRWDIIRDGLSAFAGRTLSLDLAVYASEAATNQRNQGIAHLLAGYGRLGADPVEATDVYTKQCSLSVNCADLSVMAATLADGGVNPISGERVVSAETCQHALAVLATAGLYERSGDWLYEIGLPGKSGVSGGIVTVAPGKGGLATFSPPLDTAGNSVRGQLLTKYLAERLGLNVFMSAPRVAVAEGKGATRPWRRDRRE